MPNADVLRWAYWSSCGRNEVVVEMKLYSLEPRMVFDASLPLDPAEGSFESGASAISDTGLHRVVSTSEPNSDHAAGLEGAKKLALDRLEALRGDPVQRAELAELFRTAERAAVTDLEIATALDTVIIRLGESGVDTPDFVQIVDGLSAHDANAAFVVNETGNTSSIFVSSAFLSSGVSAQGISAVLLEEVGHAIDHQINGRNDVACPH